MILLIITFVEQTLLRSKCDLVGVFFGTNLNSEFLTQKKVDNKLSIATVVLNCNWQYYIQQNTFAATPSLTLGQCTTVVASVSRHNAHLQHIKNQKASNFF